MFPEYTSNPHLVEIFDRHVRVVGVAPDSGCRERAEEFAEAIRDRTVNRGMYGIVIIDSRYWGGALKPIIPVLRSDLGVTFVEEWGVHFAPYWNGYMFDGALGEPTLWERYISTLYPGQEKKAMAHLFDPFAPLKDDTLYALPIYDRWGKQILD